MGIPREQLKQAIDLIAVEDPDVGRELDRLLAAGRIGPLVGADRESPGRDAFAFLGEAVPVQRSLLFELGPRALAERLLVKYGEVVAKDGLADGGASGFGAETARLIRRAGIRTLVDHELHRFLGSARTPRDAAVEMRRLLDEDPSLPLPWEESDPRVLFSGVVDRDTPALFLCFPWSRRALEQIAGLNLEFFGIGPLLKRLCRGEGGRLYAAGVAGELAGLLQLSSREGRGGRWLEIEYLAARPEPSAGLRRRSRGVGALLVAGAWLLWRLERRGRQGLILSSEPGALAFYEKQGFRRRRLCEYVLTEPRGRVLRCLVAMANRRADLPDPVAADLARHVAREADRLARVCPNALDLRSPALATALFFEECFRARTLPKTRAAAARALIRRGEGRGLSERLLESAAEYGLVVRSGDPTAARDPVLVVMEDRFAGHLARIMHLDSPGRLVALMEVLAEPELRGTWRKVPARRATYDELARVHTRGHIDRIAATSGREHTVLDGDTEATTESFEAARLAVGGLLNLLDALQAGPSRRGFAFLRPPGHHAEPDRPYGFCLFNNVALGARHLMERHGHARVMIVDIDAHHGNGTQAAFYDTDAVLYVSLHRSDTFPGTGRSDETGVGAGAGYTVNLPLPSWCRDGAVAEIVRRVVPPLARAYKPGFLLVSCGFDLYAHDPLGRMSVTPDGYSLLTSILCDVADEVTGGRLALVLEGGYSREGIRVCGSAVMRALAGRPDAAELYRRFLGRRPELAAPLRDLVCTHARRWSFQETDLSPPG